MSTKLKERFERIAEEYLIAFAKKQDMGFDFWIADQVGGVAVFGDLCVHLDDIRLDIDGEHPVGEILRWTYANMDNEENMINYQSWLLGLRHEQLTDDASV